MNKVSTGMTGIAGWCAVALLTGCAIGAARADPPPGASTQPVSIDLDGQTGATPGEGDAERHEYPLHIDDHGVYRLRFTRAHLNDGAVIGEVQVQQVGQSDPLYAYHVREQTSDDLFFPVIDAGDYVVRFATDQRSAPKAAYHLKVERLTPRVTDADRAAATAATERGLAFLTATPPDQGEAIHAAGREGLVLMALVSGRVTPERRKLVDATYVPFLLSNFEKSTVNAWNGHPVTGVMNGPGYGYDQSIATLALAEAAESIKSEPARGALPAAVEALLAGQNGPRKCKEWGGPIAEISLHFGGWRYTAETEDSDVSVTGWCAIALAASVTATQDHPIDGVRDALTNAAGYVRRLGNGNGYAYTPGSGANGDVRRAIGVLVALLLGDDGGDTSARAALEMDRHLAPGTQVDSGEDYPLYYAYYATRANYLRGGFEWEAWRSTMIEQLLHLQQKDGSWLCFGSDDEGGPRYTTALATMILRMCLNDVPAYLRQEVRGF